jgi:hypothetical protein
VFEEPEDEEDDRPIAQKYWNYREEGAEGVEDDIGTPLFPEDEPTATPPAPAGTVIFVAGKCPRNPGQGIRAMVVAEWDGEQYNDVQKHLLVTDHQSTTAIESHSTALVGLKRALGLSTLTKPVRVLCACKTTTLQIRREIDTTSPNITHLVARSIALLETHPGRISIEYCGQEENLATLLFNDPEAKSTTTPCIFDLSLGDEPPARKSRKIRKKPQTPEPPQRSPSTNSAAMKAPSPSELRDRLQGVKTFWTLREENRKLLGRSLANVIGKYPFATDAEKSNIWIEFLLFPSANLIKAPKKLGRNSMLVQALSDQRPPSIRGTDRNLKENPKSRSEEERVMAACGVLIRQGHIAKAARLLERETNVPLPSNVAEILQELHPEAPPIDISGIKIPETPFLAVCHDKLLLTMKKHCGGKAPGISGWTEELILESLEVDDNLPAFASMIKDILNGNLSQDVRNLIAASRLVAIPKKGGGVRPVAVGEALLRLAEAYGFDHATEVIESLSPIQLAFLRGGAEKAIHSLRAEHELGHTILSIDCINAFNRVSRQKILQVMASRLPQLLPLFCMLYGSASDLVHAVCLITSQEGVRQGGVWSSLLFCLAIQDTLEECQRTFPLATIRAYMDDIFISGPEESAWEALEWLVPRLQPLGLTINLKKSKACGSESTTSSRNCLFDRAPQGMKILGAWVGSDEATELHLMEAHGKAQIWFERTVHLHPAAALPLLRKCGAPRWTHISRTHLPARSLEATKKFDTLVKAALAEVMAIDVNQFDETHLKIITLPLREGGLGIPLFEMLLEICYNSSKEQQETQSVATRLLHKTILDSLDQDTLLHLKACRRNSASSWLGSGIPFNHFGQALQIRSRLFASSTKRFACDCGEVSSNPNFAFHILGCSQVRGTNVSSRHNAIRDCIANFCRRNAIPVACEPLSGEPGQRCDLRIGTAQDLYVDIVVVNNLCKTHKGKSLSRLEREKQDIKTSKYEEQVKSLGGVLVPFVLEAMGGMGNEARRLIKTIDKLSFSPTPSGKESPLIKEISATLQRWNGAILLSALRR